MIKGPAVCDSSSNFCRLCPAEQMKERDANGLMPRMVRVGTQFRRDEGVLDFIGVSVAD